MAYSINAEKELAQPRRPLLLGVFTFPDASVLRVSTIPCTFGGHAYEACIAEQELERLASLSEQGVDRVPSVTLRLADPGSTIWTNYERAADRGFKGASLALTFALYDPVTAEFSTDSFVPFVGLCDQPAKDSQYLTVTATAKLNLTKFYLPIVPIQPRCPWLNPETAAQRIDAADATSRFGRCGETRDLVTAPPCKYTRQTCTQPNRYGGSTWQPEKTGSGREYVSGSKIAWRNADTSGKNAGYWPLWLGGKAWITAPVLNQVADGNYTRCEVAVGVGAVVVEKVVVNGIELTEGTTGDYRWHYVNNGARDGAPNTDVPYSGAGDPYGNCTVIQVLAPHATIAPDSEPAVRILGRGKILAYKKIVSAVGDGGPIVITFDGPNEDCAGNPPFTVTITGNALANGAHTLTSWTYGPPGTITLSTTGTGNVAGGWVAYETGGVTGGGSSTPWVLANVLRWSRFADSDLDLDSFAAAANICNALISYTDGSGNPAQQARFSSAVALVDRRNVAELVRGLRQSIGGLLVPGSDGKIRLQIEGPLCEQQPAAVDGSNYNTPIASTSRTGASVNGYVAYRFDDSNSEDLKRIARPLSESPNRVQFTFQDAANDWAVSQFSVADPYDVARTEQETPGGLQVEPVGIASANQAWRVGLLGLYKIHRGNPQGDTRGTDWWEWKTSFRGCRLQVGQIVSHVGLPNAYIRITEIKPDRNYETVTIKGHFHSDSWYADSPAGLQDPGLVKVSYTPPTPSPTVIPSAPNVTSATCSAYYVDSDGGAETATGSLYGLKGTITLPTAHADYAHLRYIEIFATFADGVERFLAKKTAPYSGGVIAWQTQAWDRPAADSGITNVEFRCFNDNSAQTAGPYTVAAVLITGQSTPPLQPSTTACTEDPLERYLDAVNLTHMYLRPTAVLPANHRALWIEWWYSRDDGVTWEWLGKRWVDSTEPFDVLHPVDANPQSWKVKGSTGNHSGQNGPDIAVVSLSFTIAGLGAVAADGATSITNASASYTVDFDKCPWAFYPVVQWTNPVGSTSFMHPMLFVKLYDQAGNLSPDPKYSDNGGKGQAATQAHYEEAAVQRYEEPLGWGLPPMDEPASGFRYFRLYLYAYTRAGQTTLCNAWAGGASYGVLHVTENRRSDPPGAGLTLDSTTGKVKLATDNLSNLLMNPGFEDDLAHWSYSPGTTIQSAVIYAGSKAARISGNNVGINNVTGRIGARPGDRFYFESWVISDPGADGTAWILIRCYNAAGAGIHDSTWVSTTDTGGAWKKLSTTVTCPAGTASVEVYAIWLVGNTSGFWYVDSTLLGRILPADEMSLGSGLTNRSGTAVLATDNFANLVMNPSFEDGEVNGHPDHWTVNTSGVYLANVVYLTGTKALVVLCGAYREMCQIFSARPGEVYSMEMHLTRTAGADGTYGVYAHYLDGADNIVSQLLLGTASAGVGSWTKNTFTMTVPTGASKVRFYPVALTGSAALESEHYLLDNVYITKVATVEERAPAVVDEVVSLLNTTEFQKNAVTNKVDMKGVDFSKGFNGFDVGSAAIPKITIAPGGTPVGWIGNDTSSGYSGAWFTRVRIGGSSPADAPVTVTSGNVVIDNTGSAYKATFVLISNNVITAVTNEAVDGYPAGLRVKHATLSNYVVVGIGAPSLGSDLPSVRCQVSNGSALLYADATGGGLELKDYGANAGVAILGYEHASGTFRGRVYTGSVRAYWPYEYQSYAGRTVTLYDRDGNAMVFRGGILCTS